MLDQRRECHLVNYMYDRKYKADYLQNAVRQLRAYEAPVFIEYQSENAAFERSVLFRGSKLWNQLPVNIRHIQNYDAFERNSKQSMLNRIR